MIFNYHGRKHVVCNQKQCRAATSKKARPALGPKNAPVSIRTFKRFNKTYNEADSSKHTY